MMPFLFALDSQCCKHSRNIMMKEVRDILSGLTISGRDEVYPICYMSKKDDSIVISLEKNKALKMIIILFDDTEVDCLASLLVKKKFQILKYKASSI